LTLALFSLMPATNKSEILEAFKEFVEGEPYYGGLWRGLNIIVLDYLAYNVDAGLHKEIDGIFFEDFNSLLEMLWEVRNIAEKGKE
jgi:hypothetical protein